MARKRQSEEHKANHERWLITYSDLITLLMVFFIVMYAMSSVNQKKYEALAASLKAGFNTSTGSNMITDYQGQKMVTTMQMQEDKQLREAENKIKEYAKKNALDKSIHLKINERGLVISVVDRVLFNSGEAQLTEQAKNVLTQIVSIIHLLPNHILVEGHTDNIPIHNGRFPSNWELSTTRATQVIAYFINNGFSPNKLSAAGYSQYRPLFANDSEQNRALNRRVDIVVLRTIMQTKTGNEEKNIVIKSSVQNQ